MPLILDEVEFEGQRFYWPRCAVLFCPHHVNFGAHVSENIYCWPHSVNLDIYRPEVAKAVMEGM